MITELNQQDLFLLLLKEKLPSCQRHTLKTLLVKVGKEKYEDAVEQVFDYLDQSCGKNLSRNEVLALLSQIFNCYANYLTDTLQIPVTINTVIGNIHLLPYSVNLCFPGYAKAGLLRAVVLPSRLRELVEVAA